MRRAPLIVALVVAATACHSSSSPPAQTSAPAVTASPADLATAREAATTATAANDLGAARAAPPTPTPKRASGAAATPTRAPVAAPALMPVGSIKDGTLRYNLPNPIPHSPPDAGAQGSSSKLTK